MYINLNQISGLTNDNQKQELTFWALNKVAYFLEAGGEYDADLFRGTSLSFKVLSNDWDLLKNNQIWLHDIDKRIVRTILFYCLVKMRFLSLENIVSKSTIENNCCNIKDD